MMTPLERITRHTTYCPNTGCTLWTSGTRNGYAYYKNTSKPRKNIYLHRLVLEDKMGFKIPKGFDACHKCDTRECLNPDHLFLGTRLENVRDAVNKKRHHHGESHVFSKLNRKTVDLAKHLRNKTGLTYARIAVILGVSTGTVYDAVNGRTWRNE